MSSGHIYTGSHRSLIYTVSLILNPSQICHLNIFTLMYIHYKNFPNTFPEIPNLHICSYVINLKNFKEKIILHLWKLIRRLYSWLLQLVSRQWHMGETLGSNLNGTRTRRVLCPGIMFKQERNIRHRENLAVLT